MSEEIKYYYSLEHKAFYTSEFPGTMAAHGVAIEQLTEISEKNYLDFFNPPDGYLPVFDESGPHLEVMPEPDYIAIAEDQRTELIADAYAATYMLNLKLTMGRALTEEERKTVNAWLDYTDALHAIDLEKAPEIEWPVKPTGIISAQGPTNSQ